MDNRDAYRAFANEAPDLPLFLQPWYLDAVCADGSWEVALAKHNDRIVAALPYFLKKKLGWQYVAMPQICKQLGPYSLPGYRTLAHEIKLYDALIAQLPNRLAAFEQNFNYTVTNWLPFYWKGFQQTTLYSYVLDLTASEETLFKNIEKNYRQKIKAAEVLVEIRDDLPLSVLHRLIGQSFERQGLSQPLDFCFLEKVYGALSSHDCCRLFYAVDRQNQQVHSAALLVWDETSAYYLMSGDDPSLRNSGAAVLLKWEAIRYAKQVVRVPVFDFEGSMMRNIEKGRRDFGAQQRPYFRIWREWSPIWKWGKRLKGA